MHLVAALFFEPAASSSFRCREKPLTLPLLRRLFLLIKKEALDVPERSKPCGVNKPMSGARL
jgi:hypothetical protein